MVLVKIEQKYLENLTHRIRGHSFTKFALRERGFHRNANKYKQGEGRLCHCEYSLPI